MVFSFILLLVLFLLVKHVSVAELECLIRHEQSKRLAERLIFIRDLYEKVSVEAAAQKLGRSRATGYLWLSRWNQGGLEKLKPIRRSGIASKLSKAQQQSLKQLLGDQSWTTKEVAEKIEKTFKVKYSLRSVNRLLKRFGMHYAKPYPHDYRRPKNAKAWLKHSIDASLGSVDCDDVLLGFFDETRPQTAPNTQRVWSTNKAHSIKDTTNYKANTFGFYAPAGNSVLEFMENSKAKSVCSFLDKIKANNQTGDIVVILDNFRSHKAKKTKKKAAKLGIHLTFLPPYCPDLNPIEQLWRSLKRKLSIAPFRSKQEFLTQIEKVYNNLSKKTSFAKNWLQTFTPKQSNQHCL